MPELPEVETTVRILRAELVGRRFGAVTMHWPRHSSCPEAVCAELPGRLVTGVTRRAKYVVIHLEPADRTLLIHLRMSGRLEVWPAGETPDPYAHTVFALDDGRELRFSDTRKFGRIWLLADPDEELSKLGPEPLGAEFSPAWLRERLGARKRVIKPLLMDQSFVAGIGNIYADESLFRAKIDPRRPANSLSAEEVAALHGAIQAVLSEAIEHQGTSFDWVYPNGGMQERLQVYGRAGEPCLLCGTSIERIVLGQRGTHFCPQCQR